MCCTEFAFFLEVVDVENDLVDSEATGNTKATKLLSSDPERLIKSMIWIPVRLIKKQKMMLAALKATPFT